MNVEIKPLVVEKTDTGQGGGGRTVVTVKKPGEEIVITDRMDTLGVRPGEHLVIKRKEGRRTKSVRYTRTETGFTTKANLDPHED